MEDSALYRPILKKSWQLVRKKKGLWFFGLFAALLGTGGEYEILGRALINPFNSRGILADTLNSFQNGLADGLKAGGNLWLNIWSAIIHYPQGLLFAIVVVIIAVAIIIFIIWLAIVSQVGLIRNIDLANKNKVATINEGIDFALGKFWPVLLINFILKVVLFLLFMILGAELLALTDQGIFGRTIYYLSFIVFIIIIFSVSFLLRYQIFYLILKKQRLGESFFSAKKLFLANWLVSLEMALIIFIIYLVAAIITGLIGELFLALLFLVFYGYAAPLWLAGIFGLILFLLLLAITFFITAFLSAFQWSSWTLLFNRLSSGEGLSRIIRSSQNLKLPSLFSKK
ncbi:MAG: hypothetical protein WC518_04250 [Patescibacteria group bacterium]